MSELTKEHGSEISTAYFVCGGKEKPRAEFMESGKGAAPLIYEDEQERKDFLKGWEDAWESNTLTFELLSQDDPILAECTRIADRRVLVVERQTFRRARLGIGAKDGMWDGGYDDVWDYDSPESALNAMQTWQADEVEPDGWHRHFGTGRYRINGDKSLEWVKDDDRLSLEHNIIYAVRAKLGYILQDVSVQENSLHIGSEFPAHSKCFTVASEGVVQWVVYHYCDRSVVLGIDEMESTSVANVIERLKRGKNE